MLISSNAKKQKHKKAFGLVSVLFAGEIYRWLLLLINYDIYSTINEQKYFCEFVNENYLENEKMK